MRKSLQKGLIILSKTSEILKQKLIEPAFKTHPTAVFGTITDYHYATSTATVEYTLPGSTNPTEVGNIPMRQSLGSLIEGSPQRGDQCMVSFQNGDPLFPFISTVFNENYPQKVMDRQNREEAGKEYALFESDWRRLSIAERPGVMTASEGNCFVRRNRP